jgi:hypothetical protein
MFDEASNNMLCSRRVYGAAPLFHIIRIGPNHNCTDVRHCVADAIRFERILIQFKNRHSRLRRRSPQATDDAATELRTRRSAAKPSRADGVDTRRSRFAGSGITRAAPLPASSLFAQHI